MLQNALEVSGLGLAQVNKSWYQYLHPIVEPPFGPIMLWLSISECSPCSNQCACVQPGGVAAVIWCYLDKCKIIYVYRYVVEIFSVDLLL